MTIHQTVLIYLRLERWSPTPRTPTVWSQSLIVIKTKRNCINCMHQSVPFTYFPLMDKCNTILAPETLLKHCQTICLVLGRATTQHTKICARLTFFFIQLNNVNKLKNKALSPYVNSHVGTLQEIPNPLCQFLPYCACPTFG